MKRKKRSAEGLARRRAILAAGAAIQILTGLPAAWGVFQPPVMEEYALTEGQTSAAFSVLIAAFGAGCVLGGFLQDRKGPRTAALWGTALLSGGLFAASVLPGGRALAFWLGFSLPAGMGCAFLTPAVQSCAQKWYRDRKGFAGGVIGAAVGLSGAFLTLLVRTMLRGVGPWQGIRAAFGALGALVLPVCLGAGLLLKDPPQGSHPERQGNGAALRPKDFTPGRMLRTPQYWLCAAAVCCSTPAVLLFSPILLRLCAERGLSESAALWAVPLGSVGSAAGRLLMPMLSDRIGRRPTELVLFGGSFGLSILFAFVQGGAVLAVYAGLTFCYSALAAVLPAFSTDLFGLPHAGVNYGFLTLGQSVGSLLFPALAARLTLRNGRHVLAAAGAALGFGAVWLIRPTRQP